MRAGRLAVVLVEPREPGNIGAAARVLKNYGLSELVLVAPRCSPTGAEERARSAGAGELLRAARVEADFAAAIAPYALTIALTGVSGRHRALDCHEALPLRLLAGRRPGDRIALVFGREDEGLHSVEANACAFRWGLPTHDEFPSMNLAQAVAVATFATMEALRQLDAGVAGAAGAPSATPARTGRHFLSHGIPATQEEVSRFVDHLRRAMLGVGYKAGTRTEGSIGIARSLLSRARATQREVQFLRGFLRQVEWRLGGGKGGGKTETGGPDRTGPPVDSEPE